jgi:hypothetical protein
MRFIYFRFFDEILIIAGLGRLSLFLDLNLFWWVKHHSVVAFTVGAFLSREDKSLCLSLESMLFPKLFVEEFGDIGVIDRSEPFMHAGHNTNVIIVNLVNFLEVELFWHVTILICEDKFCNGLRHERRWQYWLQWRLFVKVILAF